MNYSQEKPFPSGQEPELLAPAGNWECVFAAAANGANAVYFGLPRFNARLRADNFTEADLPSVMNFLHHEGLKGYVTMNTLVFTNELSDALDYLVLLEQSGVDGVIVQDLGLASLVKKAAPSLELHASTQMSLTSKEGLDFIKTFLPLDRAVLARELSLRDLKKIDPSQFPLEVFIHGALCVAYSGQCLTSESLGQRSANRGECAQACRMPYEIVADEKTISLKDQKYLLSPQDLCAIDCIPELVHMGVKSFKIEGRLKSPQYVAAVTSAYRKAINNALGVSRAGVTDEDRYQMQMVFSRGFSTGWLEGTNHPRLTHGRFGKKRGVCIGKIRESGKGWIELERPFTGVLSPGDGFVLDRGEDRNYEQGGRIWKIIGKKLFFHGKATHIVWNDLPRGTLVWKTDDPSLNSRLKKSWNTYKIPEKTYPLSLKVSGHVHAPLTLTALEYNLSVESKEVLIPAQKHSLTDEVIIKQLGRLGGTGFTVAAWDIKLNGDVYLSVSVLNQLRRDLISKIKRCGINPVNSTIKPASAESIVFKKKSTSSPSIPELSFLCRTEDQMEALIDSEIPAIYLDFEDPRHYKHAVEKIRSRSRSSIFIATPRIQKPGETGFLQQIEKAFPDGVLIRNPGALGYFKEKKMRRVGDFSLNAANPLSADLLIKQGNLERLTISFDLNINQIIDLLEHTDSSVMELVLHQHMPMFHMEHCVFCSFLSKGRNHLDCNRPCEKNQVFLKDRVGQLHRLLADPGCRNTVFNGKAQSGALYFHNLKQYGLKYYRIDLLDEKPHQVKSLLKGYSTLLEGKLKPETLIQSLDAIERIGVTEGTLEKNY